MKFDENKNYCIISNCINKNLLDYVSEYSVMDDKFSFNEAKEYLETNLNKTIVFNDLLRRFTKVQKEKLLEILKLRSMHFINITSSIEEAIYAQYLYVMDGEKTLIEGETKEVLKEEKILKRAGFGLPFAVDVSTQLKYYNVLSDITYDTEELVKTLWN